MHPIKLRPIAFFAHERGDARVVKRITALQDQRRKVIGFTFHRARDKSDAEPKWENIHLGTTYNRRYFQRLWAFLKSIMVLWSHRERLGECGLIYVINTDNAVLALLGRFLVGRKIPIVLELADIQPIMAGQGLVSRALRWVERWVLQRVVLLVTTSPCFVREYFQPIQQYSGEVFLLENKVYPSRYLPKQMTQDLDHPVANGQPWIIGYFGALRCRRSLEMMRWLAEELAGRVKFVLRGYPAGTIADEFDELLGDVPGLGFGGSYFYPGELAEMYAEVDFNWAFDMSDPAGNSAWLLPNRIYEGGCFGVPALGAKTTETGLWIEQRANGWTFAEPISETLKEFFTSLEVSEWCAVKRRCVEYPIEEFTGDADYAQLGERLVEIENSS